MADRPLSGPAFARPHIDYLVRPIGDVDELRRIMSPHRVYAAYAVGQLQPDLFARSEWWTARGAHGQALLLHSRGGLGSALFTLGDVDGVEALLRLHPGPRHTFLTCQVQHLATVLRHHHVSEQQSMSRMLVDRANLHAPAGEAHRLRGDDVRQINRLYRSDGTPAFYTAQNVDEAVYYGAYDGERLIAVAGTHVASPVDALAVLGNVFTHPQYRGRGFARLVTGAVTRHLLTSCREVVLSVDPRNEPAVRAYQRLGYREVGRLIEGAAIRRDLGLVAGLRRRIAIVRGRRYGAKLVSIAV